MSLTVSLKQIKVGDQLKQRYKKQVMYCKLLDVALWSRCGHIKTALFVELREKPKGKIIDITNDDEILVVHNKHNAIYSMKLDINTWNGRDDLRDIHFNKVPNLRKCSCN